MGSNTLYQMGTPTIVDDDFDQFYTALTGDLLPRNASTGAPEDEMHSLGSGAVQWNNLYAKNIIINGVLFDPDNIGSGADATNAIVSGKTRTGSGQPDFLRASGSGASMTILATATPLQITANSITVTVSADIAVSSLTTAPTTSNTCAVNDASLSGQESSKYTGEHEAKPITISGAGSEITNRIGQYVCLKASSEYMLAFVESATKLRTVMRGFFFDSSGNPIVRETLTNGETLTLMSLGWVFLDANGTTVDVSYKSPVYSAIEPSSPVTDDYWFDQVNLVWKRYDGSAFQSVDRMLIGVVVIDSTNCVAARAFDFSKSYSDMIEIEVETDTSTTIRTKAARNAISVYGRQSGYFGGQVKWDITAHLESGLTESADKTYYLYITETGAPKIAVERPYDRLHDLRGWYHPYHSWRYVGVAYNDGSSNFTAANSLNSNKSKRDIFTSSGTWIAIPNRAIKATVQGGGGGGGGSSTAGGAGGNSTFAGLTGTGGGGGVVAASGMLEGTDGGIASGGDLNIRGGSASPRVESYFGGDGGASHLSGTISGRVNTGAANRNGYSAAYGYGGGGGGCYSSSNQGGGGGGGGGCAIGVLTALSGKFDVTVGALGANGSGGAAGGNGTAGIVIIDYL